MSDYIPKFDLNYLEIFKSLKISYMISCVPIKNISHTIKMMENNIEGGCLFTFPVERPDMINICWVNTPKTQLLSILKLKVFL